MGNVIEKKGKTIEEAISAAVRELGVKESELEIEILETPTKKFFGLLGETPAKIRATVKKAQEKPQEVEGVVVLAKNFLQEVFRALKINAKMEVEELEECYQINLSGKELGVLIGRRGQALDALQYLLNLAVNRQIEEKIYFRLDVEGYRLRRECTLKKLAKSVADRAIKTRRDVRLEPMNRHERKIIHSVLQDNDRVETHSAGEEPYRYIIVTPKSFKS